MNTAVAIIGNDQDEGSDAPGCHSAYVISYFSAGEKEASHNNAPRAISPLVGQPTWSWLPTFRRTLNKKILESV